VGILFFLIDFALISRVTLMKSGEFKLQAPLDSPLHPQTTCSYPLRSIATDPQTHVMADKGRDAGGTVPSSTLLPPKS